MNYYQCTNSERLDAQQYFNPAHRKDFRKSRYGSDVIERISKEIFIFEQNTKHIHKHLTIEYNLSISLRTIQRFYDDIMVAKSNQIDQTTVKIINTQSEILLALHGQNPGIGYLAIWSFRDFISNRLLHNSLVDSMPSEQIQVEINTIIENYNEKLSRVVSDKQNNIVKCMREYFLVFPHQYCTFYFCTHLWDHIGGMFDSQLYKKLKKIVLKQYIFSGNPNSQIVFEKQRNLNLKILFDPIRKNLKKMIHIRSKKFEFLKGLWLCRNLKNYVQNLD